MRFKTEAEFICEYGEGWRRVEPHWVAEMDNFFGKTLSEEAEATISDIIEAASSKCTKDAYRMNASLQNFQVGSWMFKYDSIRDNLKEALELLYKKFNYDQVALEILLKAKEES